MHRDSSLSLMKSVRGMTASLLKRTLDMGEGNACDEYVGKDVCFIDEAKTSSNVYVTAAAAVRSECHRDHKACAFVHLPVDAYVGIEAAMCVIHGAIGFVV
jgi:hypothetical protein